MKKIINVLVISLVLLSLISGEHLLWAKDSSSQIESNFKQYLEKAQKNEGMLNIYFYKDKYYLEIPTSKLEKEYFVSLQVARGISVYPFFGGLTLPVFAPISDYTACVYFSSKNQLSQLKDGDNVEINFYVKNIKYRSSFDNASSSLVKKSFSDNLLVKARGIYSKNNIYIDLEKFTEELPLFVDSPLFSKSMNVKFNSLEKVKIFPKNMVIYLSYLVSFKPTFNIINSLNLSSNNEATIALNIFEYENNSYRPREYDPRVGYFATTYADVSSTEGKDGYRTVKKYINRWDIENGKKITVWIENTFPQEYRETVKEGILEWNKAFNKIGYNDPIEVKIQPNDSTWEPEDIRYTTIRYQDSNLVAFAIGPSIALPTTGEIIDGDIVFYAPMLRIINSKFDYYYDVVLPSAIKYQINPLYRMIYEIFLGSSLNLTIPQIYQIIKDNFSEIQDIRGTVNRDVCTYPLEKLENAISSLTAIMISNPTYYSLNKEKFAKDYVKDIIIHEMGHILGLRHNFKASSFVTLQQLQDENYTSKNGIGYSCMDYNPTNIHFKDGKPYFTKDVFMTTLGYYDYLAIEYGYSKDESKLKKIASEAAIYYGPDEDLYVLDPDIRPFDLAKESYKWYEDLGKVYQYVIQNAPNKLYKVGTDPKLMYFATNISLNAYINTKLENVFYYTIGKHFNRIYLGDSNKTNLEMLNGTLRNFVSDSLIKELASSKPIMPISALTNSVIFGSYEWGTISKPSRTILDKSYYLERLYRLISMLLLILPLAPQYEYYYNEEIVSKNMRKLYFSLFSNIKNNQDISEIKQQSIEDFVFLLLFIQGYTAINSAEDPLLLNIIYLPNSRNQSLEIIEKIGQKMKNLENDPLSTKQNKLFAKRILYLIENSLKGSRK